MFVAKDLLLRKVKTYEVVDPNKLIGKIPSAYNSNQSSI